MVNFIPVEMQTWNRAELFHLYNEIWSPCLISFTITIDVTATVRYLKGEQRKIAPAFYYLIARALGEQPEHRMGYKDNVLGYWEYLRPLYPFLNENKNITFHSCIWKEKYSDYEKEYLLEQSKNVNCVEAICGKIPENFVLISILPFMNFEGNSFSLKNSKYYLTPTIFLGRIKEEGKSLKAPLSITFNHAVSDGYHAQTFFDRLQGMLNEPKTWLQ